jgi:RNA polymerase subunit RPABC4/transcription elongation factor Spt4
MATYKQPCLHCGEFIERDARVCPKCGSRSAFGHQCPYCLKPVIKGQEACSGCGKPLTVQCPSCHGQTFAGERCDVCSAGLMVLCTNPRCGELQFFLNTKCTACGKKIKQETRGR